MADSERTKADADVIIVGAGPGGLTTALTLAQKGLKPLIIERKPKELVGKPVRGALEQDALEQSGLYELGPPLLRHPPLAREFVSPRAKYKVRLSKAPLERVDQREFVNWLIELCEEAGVSFMYETTITGPVFEDGRVTGVVGTSADGRLLEVSSPLSIDASGIFGVLRHHLPDKMGITREIDPTDVANIWQHSFELDREIVLDLVHQGRIKPQTNVVRLGFMGPYSLFSVYVDLEEDRVDVTVGLSHDPEYPTARELVEGYVNSHPWIGEDISGAGGLVPVRRPLDSFVGDGFASVGDAACQAAPLWAGGISSAIIAGRVLGEVALEAFAGGDTSRSALWPYNSRYMEMRGGAMANADLFRQFVLTLSRDETASLFKNGIVTSDAVLGVMEGLGLEIPMREALRAGMKNISRPGLAWRLFKLSRDAAKVLDLYSYYPGRDGGEYFDNWTDEVARIFSRWDGKSAVVREDPPEDV